MLTKTAARTAPIEFHLPSSYKKVKTDDKYQTSASIYFRLYSSIVQMQKQSNETPKRTQINDDLDNLINGLDNLSIKSENSKPDIVGTTYELLKAEFEHARVKPYFDRAKEDDFERRLRAAVPSKDTVPPLTDQENQRVDQVFKKGQHGLVSQFKKVTVDYKDIYRLYPETWLNDEIINFYFELLSERSTNNDSFPSIHCFNTFFCSTLQDQGFAKVKRWTKRVDIFSKDLIFIPINQSYHWVLGVIDMKNKRVAVYDSLGGNHDDKLELFLKYLEEEHQDKKKTPYDTSDWKKETPKDIPQQGNMSDCGAFTCTFAERLSSHKPFDFSQKDMVTIRRRMALNILDKLI